MMIMTVSRCSPDAVLQRAVATLLHGGIVAYPTETFYALGVKFDIEEALRRLYVLKRRPKEKSMPLIIGERKLLPSLSSSVTGTGLSLMDTCWPGPLTLVLPAVENLSDYITAGTHTVGVRIPGESFALDLAKTARFPFTATSANISGKPPAVDAQAVAAYFDAKIDLLIDGGATPGGLPSTIVDVTAEPARILREGAVRRENMAAYVMPG